MKIVTNPRYRPGRGARIPLICSLAILFSMFLFVTPAMAANDDGFDHFTTGFPLSGAHARTECESCHQRGVFQGTPKQCSACHNGRTAPGMSNNHIQASQNCDDCHTTFSWDTNAVDHSAVMGVCTTCHQKPVNHINTQSMCDDCHSTMTWGVAGGRVDHNNLTDPCATCHTKPVKHFQTNAACDDCHTPRGWQPAKMDHSGVSGTCESCHNGIIATPKPDNHIPTTAPCNDCHTVVSWNSAGMDHSNVAPGTCISCHNCTVATCKHKDHAATSDLCDNCHKSFSSFEAPIRMDHGELLGSPTCNSAGCHTMPGPPHVTTSLPCDNCHISTISWTNVRFDHSGITKCDASCHQKDPDHLTTPGAEPCDSCHRTTSWTAVSYTHSSSDYPDGHNHPTRCSGCHTGTYLQANWPSPGYQPFCAGCHESDYNRARGVGRHTNISTDKNCGQSRCHRASSNGWG